MISAVGTLGFVGSSLALFYVNTRYGIGILPDTTRYLGISEIPYDAPLYPWILASIAGLGPNIYVVAGALGWVFVALNSILVWQLLLQTTRRYMVAAIGTALVILSPQFVGFHAMAMSEPPFLTLLLATIWAFSLHLERGGRIWLFVSAVALGLAALARFTAPPLGAAIVVCLLCDARRPVRARCVDSMLFTASSAAIFLGWVGASQLSEGRSIGRELILHGNMGPKEWLASLKAMTAWVLPDNVPMLLGVAILSVIVAAGAWLVVEHARRASGAGGDSPSGPAMGLAPMLCLFFVFYLIFMVVATAIEANLSMTGRYAFPIYVTTVLALTVAVAQTKYGKGRTRIARTVLVSLSFIVLAGHGVRTVVRSVENHASGIGYASRDWSTSPTIEAMRGIPSDADIYSNGADALAYILRRSVRFIPTHIEPRTGVEDRNLPFDRQMSLLRTAAEERRTFVVFLDRITWRFYLAGEAELVRDLSLVPVSAHDDGRIYFLPEPMTQIAP